ncbi:DUF4145 domain-containing protein (plasmid) [Rhizobium ruizarguesonis]|uniref:DUF4145 domain-containing protein n=1 Tax=Rhizobium ruizarguesonis TaxID=2081791 RepID=UPI00103198DC|nr:DUF4145 domain-containing protein [Rhizobium ruizarguesonis]TAT74812.1 DUF4145 domain-containing protein [Rhizobium ruizarguesonis]TBA99075.1 DUF4145 domain-containing protein [Rhizobium ruizarguesonis]
MSQNWRCPYCGYFSTLTEKNVSVTDGDLNRLSKSGQLKIRIVSISCPNDSCKSLTVESSIAPVKTVGRMGSGGSTTEIDMSAVVWRKTLLPEANVKPLPVSVPEEIRITYREAVLISEISGRAAAAMARRCLQGIVRDFFDIPQEKRGNLGAELAFAREKIDPDLWEDIQTLRSVGDIGAHMDKNVDQIIDVSPQEARSLIELIETLFAEWYAAREKRAKNKLALKEMLDDKRQAQKSAKDAARAAIPEDAGNKGTENASSD